MEIIEVIIKEMDYAYQRWRKLSRSALESWISRERVREKEFDLLVKVRANERKMGREGEYPALKAWEVACEGGKKYKVWWGGVWVVMEWTWGLLAS